MTFDIEKLADTLCAAANAEVLPRFGKLNKGDIRIKTEAIDLVTEGDEAAERFLRRELAEQMPKALFVGEESVAANPKVLGELADAELAVVIDPIDGTANFAANMPLFNIVAAVTRRGEAIAGIIYDPITRSYALAEKGSGAYLVQPNSEKRRLRVADAVKLQDMSGYISISDLPVDIKPAILTNLAKTRVFASYRCASHEYRALADGHAHFAMYHILNPWDHLAGTLIATEAGAYAARFDGLPYDVRKRRGTLLTATDQDSWNTLMQQVFAV